MSKSHYVDNEKFLEQMKKFRKMVYEAKESGKQRPRVPEYIGECIFKIASHLARKPNFANYTFKDDMISDGIENCLTAATKFDPEKSSNPFAYYTQIIYFAFIRRIQKEKKHQATKYKIIENLDMDAIMQNGDDSEASRQLIDYLKKQLDTIDPEKRETPAQTKTRKKKAASAELDNDIIDFMG